MKLSEEQVQEMQTRAKTFCDFLWNEVGVSSVILVVGHESASEDGGRPMNTHITFRRGSFYETIGLVHAAKIDLELTLKDAIQGKDEC